MPATVVRRLTIQAEERGSSQVVQRLRDVTEAARAVAKVTADGAVVVDMTAAKAGNLTRSYERLAGRLETNASATKNFVRDLETAKRALDSGLTSVESYKRLVGSLQAEFQSLGTAKFGLKVDQSGLNDLLGIQTSIRNSARDVAAVFEEEARASEAAAAEATRHAARIDDLRASFDPAYDAARKMADEIDRLAELERSGIAIMGGYEAALDKIALKYDENAQAAARAAAARTKMIEQARSEQTATNAAADGQSMWNSYAQIRPVAAGSARESFAVFEEDAKKTEALQARIVKLRAEINPLGAAFEKMTASIADYQDLADRQLITQDELTLATNHSREAFDRTAKDLGAFNGKLKLTAEQTKNLGFQLNDALTMFLSGSSPFQIMATQGGQVYQALGDGPGGVKGSLKAMQEAAVDAARSIGPIGIGIAAVTVAAGALYYLMRDKFESVDDIVKRQAESVRALRDAYNLLAPAAEDAGRRSAAALKFQTTKSAEKDLDNLRYKVKQLYGHFEMALQDRPGSPEMYAPLRKVYADLAASAEAGVPKFREAQDALAKIAETDPSKGFLGFGAPVRRIAQGMLEAAQDGATLQASLEGVQDELSEVATRSREAAAALKQARDDMGQFLPAAKTQAQQVEDIYQRQLAAVSQVGGDDRDMQSALRKAKSDRQKAMSELSRDAVSQAKAAQDALGNLSLSPDQRSIAEIRQRYDAEIAELERVNGAEEAIAAKRRERDAALKTGQTEIQRADDARRAGYKLDLDAVTARTAAAKASIAGERARTEALAQGYTDAEASARAEEQRTLSLAQAKEQLAESARQQLETSRSQVDQIKLEIDLVGKSAGETARLRAEFEALAAAKQAARAAGFDESTVSLTADMKKQAAAIGEATAALEELNFQRDLAFRVKQSGRSEQDQRIAEDLRWSGIDFDSAEGQRRAGMLRYVEAVEKAGDATRDLRDATKDAFASIIEEIGRGKNVFDSFIAGFAQIGQKLSSQGFDKLSNWLTGAAGTQTAPSYTPQAPAVGPSYTRSSGIGSDYTSSAPLRISTSDLASASGQIMQYSSRFNSNVDGRLLKILNTASSRFDMRVDAVSGLRPGDSRFHGKGLATDVQIYDANGKALSNYQDPGTFRAYERFAQLSKQVQSELFPELEGMLRWGGYFSGGKGKYGALDTMHFDLAGKQVGMGGGSWENGLNASQRAIWSGADSKGMTKAVSDGTIDANRRIATGAVPIPTQRPTTSEGGISIDTGSASKLGQGMQVLGVGLGSFAQGYSSGSVGGGALSGFMAGLSTGNPVMAVGGAILGAVGGIFGGKSKKKEEKRQKQMQADDAWRQAYPQLEDFRDEVNRYERGPLSGRIHDLGQAIKQFDDLAKATKRGENTGQIDGLRKNLSDLSDWLKTNFRDSFAKVLNDMSSGFGLDTEFAKARDGVMDLSDKYRGFLEDVKVAYEPDMSQRGAILAAFDAEKKAIEATKTKRDIVTKTDGKGNTIRTMGNVDTGVDITKPLADAAAKRDAELAAFDADIATAQKRYEDAMFAAIGAARESLLKILSGDIVEQSDVQKAYDQAQGAVAGLKVALVDLGMSAEDAGKAIDQALSQRMTKMRDDFTKGLQDQIDDFDGKGYLASVRDLIKQRDSLTKDAQLVGADPKIVDTFFSKAAQSLVDNAELTGSAFTDLIKLFPELTGKVKEFGAVVSSRTVQEGLDGFLSDRLAEATQKRSEAESDLLSAYNEGKDQLESYQEAIRDQLKSLNFSDNSPLSAKEQFLAAQTAYRDLQAKADAGDEDAQDKVIAASQTYWDKATAYYASTEQAYAVFDEIQANLKSADVKATSQLDLMKSQVGSLVDIKENTKTIAEAIKDLTDAIAAEKKIQADVDKGRSFGLNPERNRKIDAGVKQLGLSYTGNYGLTNGVDQFLNWRSALPADQRAAVERVINEYIGINRASGGLVTGPGTSTSDSVRLNASNGEYVLRAAAVDRIGVGTLDMMNQTMRLPAVLPKVSAAPRAAASNDNRDAEVRELRADVAKLNATIAAMAQFLGDKLDEGNRRTAEIAAPLKRAASRG